MALAAVLLFDPLAVSERRLLAVLPGSGLHHAVGRCAAASGRDAASRGIRAQLLVSVALMPVTLLLFGTFSTPGLLVNALAIPVFTFLLVPPVLLATVGYLLPRIAAAGVADRLVDLAAWVASTRAIPGWRARTPERALLQATARLGVVPAAVARSGAGRCMPLVLLLRAVAQCC